MADTFVKISCTECDRTTYRRQLSRRKKGVEKKKLETTKFCKFCHKHTLHKETK